MSLDRKDVENIAHLARIAIDEADIPDYARDLSNILDLVDEMAREDTADVLPLAHPLDAVQRLRPDAVTEEDRRAVFQAGAPAVENGLYLVPKVIE